MYVTGGEFLLFESVRFIIEIAQAEITGYIQIQFCKLVYIVYIGPCTVIESVPFSGITEGHIQRTVHSVHFEVHVQFVPVRETEQIIG